MATKIKGYVLKDGKLVKRPVYRDVSARLRAKNSKKIRVVKRGV